MAISTRHPVSREENRPPVIAPHRPHFRTAGTEIQRSTAGGGWVTIAVAESSEWAATIASTLDWLETSPDLWEAL